MCQNFEIPNTPSSKISAVLQVFLLLYLFGNDPLFPIIIFFFDSGTGGHLLGVCFDISLLHFDSVSVQPLMLTSRSVSVN